MYSRQNISTSLKRLMTEFRELTRNSPDGIAAAPLNDENFYIWEAVIM